MRTTLALFGTALMLGAVQALSPFGGRGFDGNSLDMVFGYTGVVLFVIATVYGANHGPATTKVALAAVLSVMFLFAYMAVPPQGWAGPSVSTVAIALGVAVLVLAIEERLRAYLNTRQPGG